MDKPKWKYDKVTRQHIGTEMANTDYVRWLEEQLETLKAAPAQATGAMDAIALCKVAAKYYEMDLPFSDIKWLKLLDKMASLSERHQ
jgi:hypothetical protein